MTAEVHAPHAPPVATGWGTAAALAAGGLAVTVAAAALADPGAPLRVVLAPVALVAGVVAVAAALFRFEAFVLGALVVRSSLDALGGAASRATEPATLLGGLFIVAGLAWLYVNRARLHRPGPVTWAALAFTAAAALGLPGSASAGRGAIDLVRIGGAVLLLVVVEQTVRTDVDRRRLLVALAASAVVPLAVLVTQYASGASADVSGDASRFTGTFNHPNPFAAYLGLLVVTFLAVRGVAGRWSGLCTVVAAACAAGLVATYARGAWVGALLGVMVVAARVDRALLAKLAAVVVLVVVLVPSVGARVLELGDERHLAGTAGNSLTWRLDYWGEVLDLAGNPVTGIGLTGVEAGLATAVPPHNDFLRVFVETGLVGLAAYVRAPGHDGVGGVALRPAGPDPARAGRRRGRHGVRGRVLVAERVVQPRVPGRRALVPVGAARRGVGGAGGGGRAVRILHVNKFLYRRGGAEGYMLDLAELQRAARARGRRSSAWTTPTTTLVELRRFVPPHMELEPMPGGLRRQGPRPRPDDVVDARPGGGSRRRSRYFRPDVVHLHNIYHQLSPSVVAGAGRGRRPGRDDPARLQAGLPDVPVPRPGARLCRRASTGGFSQAARRRCKGGSLAASAAAASRSWLHRRFGAYDGVGTFVSPSRFLAGQMRAAGVYPDRLTVVPNFVELDRAAGPVRRRDGGCVFAGRLSPEKGVDVLVRTAVGLAGPPRSSSTSPATARSAPRSRSWPADAAPGRVRFHGRRGRDEAAGRCWRARRRPPSRPAGTRTSRWRCWRRSPAACRSSRTDLGGLPELVEPGVTGWVVPAGDPVRLAAALTEAVTDAGRSERLGRNARARVAADFTPARHLAALDAVYPSP